jgi:hypothetical protein
MEAEMSKIALSPNASGSAVFTLAAPNTDTDRTLTLPDNTGTILTNATAGTVLQVVSVTYSTLTSISSTSYQDLGLLASITPIRASSKVLVIIQLSGRYYTQTNAARSFLTNIVRASTQIHEISATDIQSGTGTDGFAQYPALSSLVYLDSPSTTGSTTYKAQAKVSNTASSTTARFNDGGGISTITLMEIAA